MKAGILTLCITLVFAAFVTARNGDFSDNNVMKRNALEEGVKEVQPSAGSLRRRDENKQTKRIEKEKVIIIKEYDEEELRRRRRREREREIELEREREREARIKDEKNRRKRGKKGGLPVVDKLAPAVDKLARGLPAVGNGSSPPGSGILG